MLFRSFLRRENIKRINIFQYFLVALKRARYNLPLISYPDLPRPEWDLDTRLKKLLKKTNLFLLSCVHKRNWESTNFNLIPRGFSATFPFTATARIFSSFQLLSIVLRYKVNSLFFIFLSLSWPNLHRGTMKKERDKEIGSSLVLHAPKNSNS